MPTPEELNKSTADMLKRMETIYERMTKTPNGLSVLYLETVPRSYVHVSAEDAAKRNGTDAPFEVFDHVTKKRMVLVRAECGLGCRCALALVRVHKEVQ